MTGELSSRRLQSRPLDSTIKWAWCKRAKLLFSQDRGIFEEMALPVKCRNEPSGHALFAIREVARSDQGAEPGRAWLKARETIDAVPDKHPFETKYNQIASINWESCSEVLNRVAAKKALERGW